MEDQLKITLDALQRIAMESSVDGAGRNLTRCNVIANEAIDKITGRKSESDKEGKVV